MGSRGPDNRAAAVAGASLGGFLLLLAGAQKLPPGLPSTAAQALAAQLLLAGLALTAALGMRAPPGETLGLGPSRLRARETLWLVVSTLGLSHALYTGLELAGLKDASSLGELPKLVGGASLPALALALVCFALAPSLAEELLCRGLLQRILARRAGAVWAIGISSSTFAALHLDPVHAMFALPLGVQLGLAAQLGDSTRTSALCHGLNNSAAIVLAAFPWLLPPGSPLSAGLGLAIWGAGWTVLWRGLPPGRLRITRDQGLQPSPEPVDR